MQVEIYTADRESLPNHLRKLWRYRQLIWVFAIRDLRVKYSQTFLGLGWTIIQPLTGLTIYTFFFGYFLGWKAGNLPYSLYVLTGLLGWNFFSYIVIQGTASLQDSAIIMRKIYFPKAILPLSKVVVGSVELGVSMLLLIPLLFYYGQTLSWRVLFVPVLLLLNAALALFLVFAVTAMAFKKRDLYHVVPFMMYFGIWTAPVFFTKDVMPVDFQFLWAINPIAGVVEAWRFCLFPTMSFDMVFLPGLLLCIPLFLLGLALFVARESEFSDAA